MKACGRVVVLLGVSLGLLSSGVAQAEIAPIAKPVVTVAPVARPQVKAPAQATPAQAPAVQAPAAGSTGSAVTARAAGTTVRAVVSSQGGRDAAAPPARSAGGRAATAPSSALARLLPTPLALVGLHESLPSSETWPAWLLAAMALLASAEAFLLTRLVRANRLVEASEFAEPGEL